MLTDTLFDISHRVAIVTGGGRGIGREIVTVLARAGAAVAIADIDLSSAEDAAAEVAQAGGRTLAVEANVTSIGSVEALAAQVVQQLGPVDILVNNAGICINRPVTEATPEDWTRVIDVNLNGVYWCSRAVARGMLDRGSGSIVNIASMSGLVVNWPQPQSAYNASKAAVIQLTRSLASEWAAQGVRVNAVSPGYIGTDMTKLGMRTPGWGETWIERSPMGRMGTPEDVAYAVWYLASDAGRFATGTNLVIDGGYTIW